MKERLIKTALITSPIISICGVAPIFLFNSLDFIHIVLGFVLLTMLIFSFWGINIYLIQQHIQPPVRYSVSYLSTFLLHSGIILLIPEFGKSQKPLNLLIYIVVATFATNTMILIIINSELLKRKKDLAESENQKLKVGNLEAQKQVLLQQLHPHFLFNALSTLKSLIREDPEGAQDYSVKLSEFLRYSIQTHTSELVNVQNELQFTQDYLELQKVRFGEAFNCEIEIPEPLLKLELPVFALQTLVENAIKHNAFTDKKPLVIRITIDNNRLKVSNNKIPKQLIQKMGTGLKNLTERYKLVSGQTPEIIDEEHRFTVFLNLLTNENSYHRR